MPVIRIEVPEGTAADIKRSITACLAALACVQKRYQVQLNRSEGEGRGADSL